MDYKKLNLKIGLEIHRQVDSHKLFCKCPSKLSEGVPDLIVKRNLRAVESEMNEEYYIEVWESKDGWRWRLMHENGNILADSEAYSSKQMMSKTADNVAEAFKLKVVEAEKTE